MKKNALMLLVIILTAVCSVMAVKSIKGPKKVTDESFGTQAVIEEAKQ